MLRGGVVVCPIWRSLDVEGDFALLIHYCKSENGLVMTAAFSCYDGVLTEITHKMRNLSIVPDWRDRVPG